MTRVPVFDGEFGLKVRFHVPYVHALPSPKTVEIEEGEESLYPSASEFVVLPRRANDDDRRERPTIPRGAPEARFVPEPLVRQGIEADVVICPRHRAYGSGKNWGGWSRLSALPGAFAAGAPDSSGAVEVIPSAWHYDRFLDASVEAMLSARLVIATDAGLAHLAILCGRPLLLITDEGRVAPGRVVDAMGRTLAPEYWPVRLDEYYLAANHTDAPIFVSRDWRRWHMVKAYAEELLERLER